MNKSEIISDQKISATHLAVLFAFLLGIVSKDSASQLLSYAIITISAAIPFLVLSVILYQLERVVEHKPLQRVFILCFSSGHILGVLSITLILYSVSKVAGITFIVICLLLAAIVGPILEKINPEKRLKNIENE